ncbi:hypothetical protein [Maridesulfovibrio sp.]|uniref:hypothetical protein n=1 Tax=Maridesulfovibrio sp. TaxID=2795000 RepID=UPI003B00D104
MYYDTKLNKSQTASQLTRRGLMLDGVNLPALGIYPLNDNKPVYDPNFQVCAADEIVINHDLKICTQTYSVEYLPKETILTTVKSRIKAEAEKRILKIWGKVDLLECVVKQGNQERADKAAGTTDERFTQTDAIRAASNAFEESLEAMEVEELAALDVAGWAGWPGADVEGEAVADET